MTQNSTTRRSLQSIAVSFKRHCLLFIGCLLISSHAVSCSLDIFRSIANALGFKPTPQNINYETGRSVMRKEKPAMPPGYISTKGDTLSGNSIWYVRSAEDLDRSNPLAALEHYKIKEDGVMVIHKMDARNCPAPEAAMKYLLGKALTEASDTQTLAIKIVDLGDPQYLKIASPDPDMQYRVAYYDYVLDKENNPYAKATEANFHKDSDSVKQLPQYKAAAALGFTKVNLERTGILKNKIHNDYGHFFIYLERPANQSIEENKFQPTPASPSILNSPFSP